VYKRQGLFMENMKTTERQSSAFQKEDWIILGKHA
jgi:hypothetical protein